MKLFKQYLKESLVVENTELADLKKHLHDQQMKYASAQKRKDKKAMDFWNNAIKNTEEEIKYYENENFSSTQTSDSNKTTAADQFKKSTNDEFNPDDYTDHKKAKELFDSIKDASEWLLKNSDKMGDQVAWRVFKERQAASKDLEKLKKTVK